MLAVVCRAGLRRRGTGGVLAVAGGRGGAVGVHIGEVCGGGSQSKVGSGKLLKLGVGAETTPMTPPGYIGPLLTPSPKREGAMADAAGSPCLVSPRT